MWYKQNKGCTLKQICLSVFCTYKPCFTNDDLLASTKNDSKLDITWQEGR